MSARGRRRAAAFTARTTAPAPLDVPGGGALRARFDRLDALRGLAVVWMAAFHFSFDLNYFRFIRQDFYRDPAWTVQRMCIVTLFMLCVGAGQGIAAAQGQSLARFWRRVAQIAGCALLVSLGSWLMFPASFISFGVLHAIALLLVVDALPPVTFDLGMPGWAPTLKLTAHVRARPAPGWARVRHATRTIAGGCFEEDCEVWDAEGHLVAQSRQLALLPRTSLGPGGPV